MSTAFDSNPRAPLGLVPSLVPPVETPAHHASGSSVPNVSQSPACDLPSGADTTASYTMRDKAPKPQPLKSGRRGVPEALKQAGIKRRVPKATAARTPSEAKQLFKQAGRAASVPATYTAEIHVEPLPEALHVQGSPVTDSLPLLEDLAVTVTAGMLPQIALPSAMTIQEAGKTTSLTPRQSVFAATDAWTPDGKLERPLKCRVCPEDEDSTLRDWVNFKRHCKTSSSHPSQLYFCKRCWRPFCRMESCVRHVRNQALKGPATSCQEKVAKSASHKR
ncbi:hypothetical protein BC834DRAFT_691636 [Gloeopeniophorella convolvens]|nr:hypothetical protein BC834DRAFT_691636 [Gloeopeniophorella convolvens]